MAHPDPDSSDGGYYDPRPRRLPVRPVVLAGLPGVPVTPIALQLAARAGLPHVDILRAVEHRAGRSLLRFLEEQGACAFRTEEELALEAALRARPAGIVALGPGTLGEASTRARVQAEGVLVALRADPERLARRLLEAAPHPSSIPWIPPVESVAELALALANREEFLEDATLTVTVEDRHPSEVVEELLELLDLTP